MNNADKDSEPDSSKDGSLDLLLDTALAVFALPIGSNLIFQETFTGIAKEHHAFLIGVKAQKVMTEHGSCADPLCMIKNLGNITTQIG